jgi:hypothetical protein
MSDETTLFAALAQLKAAWPNQEWTWDGRMMCVTSSFGRPLEAAARAAMALALPVEYSRENLASAPAGVREISRSTGGVRAGQLLVSDPGTPGAAFGLWWPWANGHTISLRIGLLDVDDADPRYQRLRDLFGTGDG